MADSTALTSSNSLASAWIDERGKPSAITDAGLLAAIRHIRDRYVLETGGRRPDGQPAKAMRHHGAPAPESVLDLELRMAEWIASTVQGSR